MEKRPINIVSFPSRIAVLPRVLGRTLDAPMTLDGTLVSFIVALVDSAYYYIAGSLFDERSFFPT